MEFTIISGYFGCGRNSKKYFKIHGLYQAKKNELKPFNKEYYIIPAEKSADFVCQMEKVLEVYERPYNPDFPVVCLDESPKQIIDYQVFTGTDGTTYQDSEYPRLGVAELFVAFEPLAGHRVMTVEKDHKTEAWVHFIANQMDTTYKNATKVTWVMDNLSTHKDANFYKWFTPEVAKAYLERLQIVYTPKHGSWLNMAEIQFSIITRQVFDRPFKSKDEVQAVVKKWVEDQNKRKVGAK